MQSSCLCFFECGINLTLKTSCSLSHRERRACVTPALVAIFKKDYGDDLWV